MPRRVLVDQVQTGRLRLSDAEAHHLRDVLRHEVGDEIEVFDASGTNAIATIESCTDAAVWVDVKAVREDTQAGRSIRLTLASAVPKANRADWLIEKLAELGVDTFVPLAADRSVVLPDGKNKLDRWRRLSVEASKQSRRSGVMTIEELRPVVPAIKIALTGDGAAWCLSTEADFSGIPILDALKSIPPGASLTIFIGPEGGWTPAEVAQFRAADVRPVRLTETILRIETAGLTAAAVVGCWTNSQPSDLVNVANTVDA